jgi:PAS domain S-box-containing protein
MSFVDGVAALASAASHDEIVARLRESARGLVGADGIAVAIREGGHCRYVAEDAQSPLFAGQSFDLDVCVAGLAMITGAPVIVGRALDDPRVPRAAYEDTFVRSLAIAPIGNDSALCAYWAHEDEPAAEDVAVLTALARAAAAARANIHTMAERVRTEAQLRGVLDSVSDSYYALDRNWRVVEFSRSAENYFRLKREDVIGASVWDLFPRGRGGAYEALCRKAMDDGEAARLEVASAFRPDRTVEMRTAPMRDGISVSLTDITERVQAEAEVRRQTEELQAVLDAVPAAIWIAHNAAATDIVGNRFSRELLRIDEGRNMSKSAEDAADLVGHFRVLGPDGAEIPPEDLPVQRAARGENVARFEERIVFDDGAAVHLIGNAVPLLDSKGRPRGAVAAFNDITHLKHAEQELRDLTLDLERRIVDAVSAHESVQRHLHEAQKTEALGQMAGGVAHDFNNLLSPILGGLELLKRRATLDARATRLVDAAIESAERARLLVQRMLAFARRQPLQTHAVNLAGLVHSMTDLLKSSVGARVRIEIVADPAAPPALGDSNQLELALLNLALNARDAMPDGGALTISITPAGGFVSLAVADTGVGMDEATARRAIEPFFSTKGVGKGTGLGLSMVHGLAAQLGGRLEIASTPGVGTRVVLMLPVAGPELSAPKPRSDGADAPASGSVLLVDDEAPVRETTRAMLEDLGYAVTEAGSAQDALRLLENGLNVDWIVTDHMMPGMTGADLARTVRQRRPHVRVLLISGYADLDDIAPDVPHLAKPFRQSELVEGLASG